MIREVTLLSANVFGEGGGVAEFKDADVGKLEIEINGVLSTVATQWGICAPSPELVFYRKKIIIDGM